MIFDIVYVSNTGILFKEVVFGEAYDLATLLLECGFDCRLACYGGYENAVEIFS